MSLRVELSHQEEKLRARLHGAGLKLTHNRLAVLDVFLAGTEPVTITDLWLRTKKVDPRTSHSTVVSNYTRFWNTAENLLVVAPPDSECRRGPGRPSTRGLGRAEIDTRGQPAYGSRKDLS